MQAYIVYLEFGLESKIVLHIQLGYGTHLILSPDKVQFSAFFFPFDNSATIQQFNSECSAKSSPGVNMEVLMKQESKALDAEPKNDFTTCKRSRFILKRKEKYNTLSIDTDRG